MLKSLKMPQWQLIVILTKDAAQLTLDLIHQMCVEKSSHCLFSDGFGSSRSPVFVDIVELLCF